VVDDELGDDAEPEAMRFPKEVAEIRRGELATLR